MFVPTVGYPHHFMLPLWAGWGAWGCALLLLLLSKSLFGWYLRDLPRRMEKLGNIKSLRLARLQACFLFLLLEGGLVVLGKLILDGSVFTEYR